MWSMMTSWTWVTKTNGLRTSKLYWPRLPNHHRHYRFTHQLQLLVLNYSLDKFQSIWMKVIFYQCFNALVISMNFQYFRIKIPERIKVSWNNVFTEYFMIIFFLFSFLVTQHNTTYTAILYDISLSHSREFQFVVTLTIDEYSWDRWWDGIHM